MTGAARSLLMWLAVLPLGCPLLRDDDFVIVPTAPSEPGAGGAPAPVAPDLAGSPAAAAETAAAGAPGSGGASGCGGENWSERGDTPRLCEPKSPK
jgi:hypothetical protein